MRPFAAVCAFVVIAVSNRVAGDGVLTDPLAIIVKLPAMLGLPSNDYSKEEPSTSSAASAPWPSSSEHQPKPSPIVSSSKHEEPAKPTTSSVYVEPTPSSSAPPPPPPTTSAPPQTSSYSQQPQETQNSGDIPDGQGNNFNVPAGAVRFPWNYNNADKVVPITPKESNGGWAMSPNQMCKPNSWCPYACEPGYYSAQWDPSALVYNGQGSMNGGLYADGSGKLSKPFPSKPFCAPGMFNAGIKNTLGQSVSACQTVYPGNEAMIIPSVAQAGGYVDLNIVPHTYWLGTSSQFYVNLAGSTAEQCIWGNADKPIGNWGPFIFGGGQGADGNTYISVQYNPLYLSVGFKATDAYNVKIECESGQCNFPSGGECKCEQGVCSVDNGCTVTLSGNAKANFVIY
ncbi:hypothetical protein LPJ55_005514 [Coemansia sp. RSA 990]|nr:hypothetical protein BX667DRAFT_523136 [Coemansia mojavensis]KAJ1739459.1 hypothetical protein LPJ68_004668 [Coemansia sp. RSA 1086]KAJ1869201.1 hypothetical protein LPJ55_005514 [Coemansia sp. RSA 990]KAJ2646437.1 hypothetical protein IWW40_005430 [Coemansia sp. RSA 1250]KAJ2668183.1 hypothetical protein IWW42_005385 [Coemansia sp. RSA 1085]